MDGPLFIWMEVAFRLDPNPNPNPNPGPSPSPTPTPTLTQVAFRLGYDPALRLQLDSAVAAQHAAWALSS